MFKTFDELAERQLAGARLDREDALAVLAATDDQVLDLVAAAARLRRAHFGDRVKVNYLVNLKSGLCPEDCSYCSQRLGSTAEVLTYSWLSPSEQVVAQATAGIRGGASRVCLVASGRGPGNRDIDRVAGVVDELKCAHPGVEVCACLGLLKDGQADRLSAAGRRRLQPQPQHQRGPLRRHLLDAHVRRPRRHRRAGQARRASPPAPG